MLPLTDFIEHFKHVAHPVSGLTLLIDCFFKCHSLLITLFTPLLWLVLLEFLCYCGLCRTSETQGCKTLSVFVCGQHLRHLMQCFAEDLLALLSNSSTICVILLELNPCLFMLRTYKNILEARVRSCRLEL